MCVCLIDEVLTTTDILSDNIRITMAFAVSKTARFLFYSHTSQLLLRLHVSQLVLSLQTWQRFQEFVIYITLQWRIGCSLGFLWLTFPGRITLTAHRKEERLLVQFLKLGWTQQSQKVCGLGEKHNKTKQYKTLSQ